MKEKELSILDKTAIDIFQDKRELEIKTKPKRELPKFIVLMAVFSPFAVVIFLFTLMVQSTNPNYLLVFLTCLGLLIIHTIISCRYIDKMEVQPVEVKSREFSILDKIAIEIFQAKKEFKIKMKPKREVKLIKGKISAKK